MVACFHPGHTFAGLPPDDPLHYEKRSPYPVINLLRAPSVDEYIAQGKTQGIADNNERRLRQVGRALLKETFEAILAMD
ncbi:hypothetical protein JKP88DRAFT_196136 [Tribonema minus]|uniref:Uncharacterized protein n=1 Tax=Tribonema minus TaxID=303371 RepID=A0A835YZ09_9STRA|nr:hypothetical protein JKP88DRAFT_196136 [Tribonema minus]